MIKTNTNNILIFTASYGLGHNSVAQAVKSQIIDVKENVNVEIKDILDFLNPIFSKSSIWIYKTLTRKYPKLYNFIYEMKDEENKNLVDETFYMFYADKIKEYVDERSPKLIISTFPTCSGIISKMKHKYNKNIPLITIITDVVDSWEWIHDYTDMYFVPTIKVAEKLIKKGIGQNNIKITGIPVKKEFLNSTKFEQNKNQVLIMASAMDKLGISEEVLNQLDVYENVKSVIVTGSNKELFEKLYKKQYNNIKVLGFTNNIAELMDESSIIITKPGGVTLFESINKGVPMVIKNSNVGQEKANVQFIKEMGIGIFIDGKKVLTDVISEMFSNKYILENIKQNIKKVKKQINSSKVGEYAIDLIA